MTTRRELQNCGAGGSEPQHIDTGSRAEPVLERSPGRPARAWAIGLLIAGFAVLSHSALGAGPRIRGLRDHDPKSIVTIFDTQGRELSEIAHGVSPGDYLITQDNKGWVVSRVEGRKAYAKYDGKVDLLKSSQPRENLGSAVTSIWGKLTSAIGGSRGKAPVIGIYCSHSDESYQPTTGVANAPQGKGDIYRVASTLKQTLEAKGFTVIQSMNNHNPHDAAAYTRSRRTVAELMKYQPVALVDVHRDAIPDAGFYQKNVKGEEIAATRIVVGKQNANSNVNLDFAKRIKAEADAKYPGLVKEIFWGHGNYNQDTGPKTILVEFGTHTNPENLADKGAELMGAVLPVAITGKLTAAGASGKGGISLGGAASWTSLLWVIGIVAAIAIGFVALNRGGVEFGGKGRGTTANFLGRLRRPRSRRRRGR